MVCRAWVTDAATAWSRNALRKVEQKCGVKSRSTEEEEEEEEEEEKKNPQARCLLVQLLKAKKSNKEKV